MNSFFFTSILTTFVTADLTTNKKLMGLLGDLGLGLQRYGNILRMTQ